MEKIKVYYKEELKMSYRKSSLNKNEIIVEAIFKCKKGKKNNIENNIKNLKK